MMSKIQLILTLAVTLACCAKTESNKVYSTSIANLAEVIGNDIIKRLKHEVQAETRTLNDTIKNTLSQHTPQMIELLGDVGSKEKVAKLVSEHVVEDPEVKAITAEPSATQPRFPWTLGPLIIGFAAKWAWPTITFTGKTILEATIFHTVLEGLKNLFG